MARRTLGGLVLPAPAYRLWLSEVDPLLAQIRRLVVRSEIVWTAAALIAELEREAAEAASRRLARKSFLFRPPLGALQLFESAVFAVRGGAEPEPAGVGRPVARDSSP